ncbi:MAG: hypothetical protein LBD44_00135 [Spirochaetaceae bacterium]|jgi:hypothetical protein|nr:hypothetical protein [Spirochaetaceae bacterium]
MANLIFRRTGYWIQHQLKLSALGQKEVAGEANVSLSMVTHFLGGRKDSERVRTALCKVLGYESFGAVIAASRGHVPQKGARHEQVHSEFQP